MTPRQQKYLDIIRKYIAKHNYSPTYAELAKLAGVNGSAQTLRSATPASRRPTL